MMGKPDSGLAGSWFLRLPWSAGAGIAVLALAWAAVSTVSPAYILPTPLAAFKGLRGLLATGELVAASLLTLRSLALCTAMSLAGGLALGIAAYRWRWLEQALHPITVILEQAPTIAWLVLAILWLGLGVGPAILVGVSMALPLFYLATVHGLRQVDSGYFDMARVFGLSSSKRLGKILLPSLVPTLVGTSSGALSVAWRGIIMAEAFASTEGLGPLLWGEYLFGDIATVYAMVLWILALGLVVEYGIVHPVRVVVYRSMSNE